MKVNGYKSNNNVTYSNKYHIVWTPKYRRPVLQDSIAERLDEIIENIKVEIIAKEIMPNHVHLLLECEPQFGIHKVVKRLKGTSSRILRQEFEQLTRVLPTLWTNAYFLSTVGGAPLSVIKQYVENQKNV